MVALAKSNGGYTETLCTDLSSALCLYDREDKKFNMIVAADTFLYVGALSNIFRLAHLALQSGGLFMFSTEDLDSSPMKITANKILEPKDVLNENTVLENEPVGAVKGWGVQLLSSARFAHSSSYINQLADMHQFSIIRTVDIVIRKEQTVPLPGKIFILQKI